MENRGIYCLGSVENAVSTSASSFFNAVTSLACFNMGFSYFNMI